MKKTVIASVAFAAALFAVSCQKETNPVQNVSGPMTISAVSEGLNTPTKTEMIFKYDVAWSANDKIYVKDASGNHDTFSLQGGAGTTKGTFKQDGKTTFTGEVQAYYPATMLDGGSPVWPASQTNDQTIPMYCKKTLSGEAEERMDFSSLGSVLQIVFNTTKAGVTLQSIEIKDGSKTMSGEFTVNNGIAEITAADNAGITLDLGEGVAVGLSAKYFNISVPSGNYEDLTLIFTAKDGKKCEMTGGKVNIAYNTVGRLTLTGKEFKIPGALSGVFTVGPNATDKVHFSQGNLQATYTGSSYTWSFAANQYDFIGNAAGNTTIDSQTNGAVVDLFGWVGNSSTTHTSSPKKYGVSTSQTNSDYGNSDSDALKADWGTAIDDKGTWRTLSKDEWTYLFNSRTDAASKVGCATVGGVNGIIILPDTFTDPMKNNGNGAFVPISSWSWTQNVYTSGDNWNAMETAGAVFLPAAGGRYGSDVNYVGDYGYYWSSTASGSDGAYGVDFSSSDVSLGGSGTRGYGFSVRLVTEEGSPAPSVVPVESVSLDKTAATLNVNGTVTLSATVLPDNATDKSVSWSSNNTGVATVDASGKVTAVAAGTATITVTTTDGGKSATCSVTVKEPDNPPTPGNSLVGTSWTCSISDVGNYVTTYVDATLYFDTQSTFIMKVEETHVVKEHYIDWNGDGIYDDYEAGGTYHDSHTYYGAYTLNGSSIVLFVEGERVPGTISGNIITLYGDDDDEKAIFQKL